jgi:hypothetical protein
MNRALRARTHAGSMLAAAGVLMLGSGLALLAGPAAADPVAAGQVEGDPIGHNGDIKITAVDDDSTPPENNPMQGCSLSVEWYDFDAGDLISHLTFESIEPTADAVLEVKGLLDVQVGEDAAGGGTDRDAREDYTFTTIGEPGPQGFHVKLDVHTPGVTGFEKKTKVFWIGDCSSEQPSTEEPLVGEPLVGEPLVGEPIVDPPAEAPADPPADPSTDESVSDPAADAAEVPLVIDAGTQASASEPGQNSTAPGLALVGALLALGGYFLARSPKSGGAHRR